LQRFGLDQPFAVLQEERVHAPVDGVNATGTEWRLASYLGLRLIPSMPAGEKNTSVKKAAARLVRQLPDTASWDDLMYEILVRQKIEAGLGDLRNGRKHDHASIRSEFGAA
jgi:hypothetical protein